MNSAEKHICKPSNLRKIKAYDASDLLGAPFTVLLNDAVVGKYCEVCGEQIGSVIPKPQELVAVVATLRACDPVKLNGRDIKFLRKALRLKGKEFAESIGISSTHLSKLENGHEPITNRTERSLRMHVCIEFFDKTHVAMYDRIKKVPSMQIRSVRCASKAMSYNLSLELPAQTPQLPNLSEDEQKKYKIA